MRAKFLNLVVRQSMKGSSVIEISRLHQETFLKSLNLSVGDFDRSYNQYKCQIYLKKKHIVLLNNIISLLVFFPILSLLCLKSFFTHFEEEYKTVVIWRNNNVKILPQEILLKKFIILNESPLGCLTLSDLQFIFKNISFRYFSFYFLLKIIIKIAQYREAIVKHKPELIVVGAEFSFTSSVLTLYCNENSVKHINVMHGEKLYNIRDSFFRYNKCYIWHDFYKHIFVSLNADPDQFEVYTPLSFVIGSEVQGLHSLYADFKYYLALFNESDLIGIVNSMTKLKNKGYSIKYRPHPMYSDLKLLSKYVSENEIENPHLVQIEESVANVNYAVGSYSTSLLQAYYAGNEVVMDNVQFQKVYSRLKELDYFLLNTKHHLLSNFIL